jgi:predicted transcriptional regulator
MAGTSHRKHAALASTIEATQRVHAAEHDLTVAVARAAHWGATWAEIAAALGVTPQAAHKRFRHLRYDPKTRRAWHEPPLPM